MCPLSRKGLHLSSAMVTNVSENEKCVCVLMNRDGALR